MRVPRHPTKIRRMLDSRVQQLTARKPLLAASLVSFKRRCGKPSCHCAGGEKHHGHQLTYKVRGTTRTVYVPVDLTAEVRAWIDEVSPVPVRPHLPASAGRRLPGRIRPGVFLRAVARYRPLH